MLTFVGISFYPSNLIFKRIAKRFPKVFHIFEEMLNNIAKNNPLYSKLQLKNKELTCGGNGKSTPLFNRKICESTGKVVYTVESIGKMYFNKKKIESLILQWLS